MSNLVVEAKGLSKIYEGVVEVRAVAAVDLSIEDD